MLTDQVNVTRRPARCPHCGRALTTPRGVEANYGPDRICSACALVPATNSATPNHSVRAHVERMTAMQKTG